MKRIFFAAFTLFAFAAANAQIAEPVIQASQKTVVETLELESTEHDFGTIPQNKPVYYYFEVVNKGTVPFKINVTASCGCTTPEWNKEAIAPGATEKIKVGYNAASEGYFKKDITITYNENQTKQLIITGTVWKAPVGSAPANQSVQFLKQQIQ